jgi:hypothetical protein
MIDDHTRRPTESEGSRPDGPYAGLLDESRLEPDERELWHELCSQDPEEAPAMKLWSFGHETWWRSGSRSSTRTGRSCGTTRTCAARMMSGAAERSPQEYRGGD